MTTQLTKEETKVIKGVLNRCGFDCTNDGSHIAELNTYSFRGFMQAMPAVCEILSSVKQGIATTPTNEQQQAAATALNEMGALNYLLYELAETAPLINNAADVLELLSECAINGNIS